MLEKTLKWCGRLLEEGLETTFKTGVYFGLGALFKTAHLIHGYEGIDLRRDAIKPQNN